jgi:hypothetical protein
MLLEGWQVLRQVKFTKKKEAFNNLVLHITIVFQDLRLWEYDDMSFVNSSY